MFGEPHPTLRRRDPDLLATNTFFVFVVGGVQACRLWGTVPGDTGPLKVNRWH